MADAFDYRHDDVTCRGFVALPAGDTPVPGVVLYADITGVGEHTRGWADRIAAELGMVALAADIYGEGAAPKDFVQGREWLESYRNDPPRLRARAAAAVTALKAHPRCDGRMAAIGFCFGGSVVLEMARDGNPDMLAGVSFHGGLSTPAPAGPGAVTAKLLVCHGAEDPLVPQKDFAAFLVEMRDAGADCQTIAYTGAVHSFTNPNADKAGVPGVAYHAPTARRSWSAMAAHFAEVFG